MDQLKNLMSSVGDWFAGLGPQVAGNLDRIMDGVTLEPLFKIGSVEFTSVSVTITFLTLMICSVVILTTRNLKVVPTSKVQMFWEMVVTFVKDTTEESLGKKVGNKEYGFFGTFVVFLIVLNFTWLLPPILPISTDFYRNPTASYSIPLALTTIGFIYGQVMTVKYTGLKAYGKEFLQPSPIMAFNNVLGLVTNPLSLSLRLFGNMFAGVITGLIVASVASVILPLFFIGLVFNALDLLTGVIQAYVFFLLLLSFAGEKLGDEYR